MGSFVMWSVSALAILGNIFVIKKWWMGYAVWIITNIAFVVRNFTIGEVPQAILFIVYTVMSFWGLISWLKQDIKVVDNKPDDVDSELYQKNL